MPAGMDVTTSGLVTWTPTDADIGDHPISFSVTDSLGSMATEFLYLTVLQLPEPPVYVTFPPAIAYANAPYTVTATAVDPDVRDEVRYSIVSGPAGLTYEHIMGVLSWSPLPSQVGSHPVTIRATDRYNLYVEHSFTLTVRPTNTPPSLDPSAAPPTTAAPFLQYTHQLLSGDPDAIYGDTTLFTQVSGPTGLTVSPMGLVDWTPTTGQLGTHQVSVLLTDSFGASTPVHWYIHVRSQNHPPRFVSTPVQAAYDATPYSYTVSVDDPDAGDIPTLALVTGPTGMQMSGNAVTWTPGTADVGRSHAVSISATDRESAVTTQDFVVYVSGTNGPPTIDSQPILAATQGTGYLYQLLISDPNPLDTFTFDFPIALAGMSASPAGTITWTPAASQIGAQPVEVRVTDRGGLTATQPWTIDVANVNDPPSITSSPVASADEGQPYSYVVTFTDPDPNDSVVLILEQSPPGMQLDPLTSTVFFTPTIYDLGFHAVAIRARDAAGASDLQTFTLTVNDTNDPPRITSTPSFVAHQGEAYRYNIRITDPDTNDTHTYHLDDGPSGMVVDVLAGTLDFTPTLAQVGQHSVTVRVTDGHQVSDTQTFTLDVQADTTDPVVTVTFTPAYVDAGQSSTVQVTATDNVSVVTPYVLTVDGVPVTLNGNHQATITTSAPGFREAVATVTDPAGNVGTATRRLGVRDPSDVTPPVVQIVSPVEDDIVTAPTDVVGTINDDNLLDWRLTATPAWATAAPIELATGTASVTAVVLGQFDPTLLENGLFMLRLEGTDINGATTAAEVGIRVEGNMKIGVFTLSFVDLAIPVSGIPITVTRTYDSRVKTQGDFGIGWTLDVAAGRYQNNRTPGVGWTITNSPPPNVFPCAQTSELVHHRTEIRISDAEFYSFRPMIPQGFATVGACASQVTYVQDGGSTPGATLEVIGDNFVYNTSGATELRLDDGTLFDPQQVRLTTYDGRIFDVDQDDGIVRMEDRNGNELFIGPTGITHESGKGVVFTRDAQGRITRITDPMGHTLDYGYDAAGDLVLFTDQEGHSTEFRYQSGHYLVDIINPLGVNAIRSEYDASGRLVATIDPDGNRIELTHDLATRRETVRNRLNEVTYFDYDARGNVVQETYPDSSFVTRTYDVDDNVTSSTDELGRTTTYTYDAFGNKTTETNALTETSTWTFDATGLLTQFTDPRGAVTTYTYDSRRNLRFETDPEGYVVERRYAPTGNIVFESNGRGFRRRFDYDGFGNLAREVDERDVPTVRTYDQNGVLLTETTTRSVGGQVECTGAV